MEFLNELLKDLDNRAEIIEKIKKELPKHFIPKHEFNNKNEELKAVKAKMEELEGKVAAVGNSNEEKDALRKQIEALTGEFTSFKSEADKRVTDLQKRQALEKLLIKNEANNDSVDLLISQVDLSNIVLDSKGNIVDEDIHINPIKESRPSLFAKAEIKGVTPPDGKPNESSLHDQYNKFMREGNTLAAAMVRVEAKQKGIIF